MRRNPNWLAEPAEGLLSQIEAGTFRGTPVSPDTDGVVDFDFVIVGSGYGGAVAAARLAELTVGSDSFNFPETRPFSVCVLERGREYVAGTFPSTFSELPPHVRMEINQAGVKQYADGLFDLRLGGDVSALLGNGLGGGSLINAGVAEEPSASVLRDHAWPRKWREPPPRDEESNESLLPPGSRWQELLERAASPLCLNAETWLSSTEKSLQVKKFARNTSVDWRAVRLSIAPANALDGSANPQGIPESPCLQCGDCFTGCNHGAKRTLAHTYLAKARKRGANLYTGVTVRAVETDADRAVTWRVRCVLTDPKKVPVSAHDEETLRCAEFTIRARHVILAAGTFGSTEILMRSRKRGLSVSTLLGSKFSANGDMMGAAYNTSCRSNAAPREDSRPVSRKVGPTITSIADSRHAGAREQQFAVQDLAVPAALRRVYEELLSTLHLFHRWVHFDLRKFRSDEPDPLAVDQQAIERSMLYAVMGRDSASGRLEMLPGFDTAMSGGGLTVKWPGIAKEAAFSGADKLLKDGIDGDGTYIASPLWRPVPDAMNDLDGIPDASVFTTHPLGGCPMGENPNEGVVDSLARVFNLSDQVEDRIHIGLFVLDGSIIPLSLGINPLLTITALAEGLVDEWVAEFGWVNAKCEAKSAMASLPLAPVVQSRAQSTAPTSLNFSERMTGDLAVQHSENGELPWRVMLTTDFDPIPDISAFLQKSPRDLGQTAEMRVLPPDRRLNPRAHSAQRSRSHFHEPLKLKGAVYWLEREESCVLPRVVRALTAYAKNRLAADWVAPQPNPENSGPLFLIKRAYQAIRSATTVGDARLLRYKFAKLDTEWKVTDANGNTVLCLPKDSILYGQKRLAYVAGGNPWRQLSEMTLMVHEPGGKPKVLAELEFDKMYMLGRYETRARLSRFQDAPRAWLDLASLTAYMFRVITSVHFWSFRAADYPKRRKTTRLPQPFANTAGYGFKAHEVVAINFYSDNDYRIAAPKHLHDTTRLRLSNYWSETAPGPASLRKPVILFHGFGSGGVQFTHEGIPVPLAKYLADSGFDVWVAELRTSIGLESSHQQWTMDAVARNDVPKLIEFVLQYRKVEKVSVVAHCIGSAMFCMAVLDQNTKVNQLPSRNSINLHKAIDCAVLLQVGPYVRLPEDNRARGYVGRWLQRLTGMTEISSTVDDSAKSGERLAERLLGSFPYPKYEAPRYALTGNLDRNRWIANANRSAAVFSRLFEWKNISDSVFDALPDLLGHCNLKTYRQTVHYTFLRKLTDFSGDPDAYVTDKRMKNQFDFPVRFIHGEKNVVFDPKTTLNSLAVLQRLHGKSGRDRISIPGFGHLDSLVGEKASEKIFPHIAQFLNRSPAAVATPPPTSPPANLANSNPRIFLRGPTVGPWLGSVRVDQADNKLVVRIGLRSTDYLGEPLGVIAMAVVDDVILPNQRVIANSLPACSQGEERAIDISFDCARVKACHTGIAVWTMCAYLLEGATIKKSKAALLADFESKVRKALEMRNRDLQSRQPLDFASPCAIELSKDWLDGFLEQPRDVAFAVASCRMQPLIFDRLAADRSMESMLRHVERPGPAGKERANARNNPLRFAIFAGDQIYADPSAGQFDPEGVHDKFVEAYREAYTSFAQSEVMRRIPCYMMMDDHEIRDNHTPLSKCGTTPSPTETDFRAREDEVVGKRYALRYQINPGPGNRSSDAHFWYSFQSNGLPFFVCDTRNERIDPKTISRRGALILDTAQSDSLCAWMIQRQESGYPGPKFIVTPVPVFPLSIDAEAPLETNSDAWARFPASLEHLLTFIATRQISNVVLLSGDAHCFLDVEASLVASGHPPLKLRAIVAPGLYSPYPFANSHPDEYVQKHAGKCASGVTWNYNVLASHSANGWVKILANPGCAEPLDVQVVVPSEIANSA